MSFYSRLCGIHLSALAAVAVLAAGPPCAAAPAAGYRARLDSLFTILDTNQRMMGSITIRKADRVLYERAIGARDSTSSGWVRSDQETMFRIGSVTKPFTAVLIYRLVDEGRLSLDTPLSKFFPQFVGGDSITVKDLLGHTSGLPDYTPGMDPMKRLERSALLGRIAAQPLQFRPGTKWRYSNSNHLLLGYIIESVTDSTYEAQLQRKITGRIGLRRTHFGSPVTPRNNEARAYFFSGGRWELQPDHAIDNAGGAGGIVSTTNDLSRFLGALFQGRLISPRLLSELTNGFSDASGRHGKGLSPFEIPGTSKSGFSHDGSIGAHAALVGYVPEDSLALALTINGYNYPINQVFFLVWGILYGTGVPLPSFAPVPLPGPTAAGFVGAYSADAYGLTITIRDTGGTLAAQVKGEDAPFTLTYIGRNRFLADEYGIWVEFADPVDGAAPRFTLYQQQAAIPLVRMTGSK